MQEGSVRQDAETWLRYLLCKVDKQMLDISALESFTNIVMHYPEYKELFASLLIGALETESEMTAVMVLHVVNVVIFNLRLTSKDTFDAEFLGKILDLGLSSMEYNLKKNWEEWRHQLGRTLMEWKLCYKIENRLSPTLSKIVDEKENEKLNFKDQHYSVVEEPQQLTEYLRENNTEAITIHLTRVWKYSLRNPEPSREPYQKMVCGYSNSEGWNTLTKITYSYIESMLSNPNTKNLIFRNTGTDKLSLIPQVFASMHCSKFIESSVGASVRAQLNLLKKKPIQELIYSKAYENCIVELISFLKYTLENLHSLSPYLAKFLCEICSYVEKVKGEKDHWNEVSGLLVLRLLAPAVCNPVCSGIISYAEVNAVQLLTYTAKIIQHSSVGKPIEHGELSELTWLNQRIPAWKEELQQAFEQMYNTRKPEPKEIALPKTLILHDLSLLSKYLSNFKWKKCPEGSTSSPIYKKPTIPQQIHEEIEEDFSFDEEEIKSPIEKAPTFADKDFSMIGKSSIRSDELEDSTPSMQALPPVFSNGKTPILHTAPPDAFRSKEVEIVREQPIFSNQSFQSEPEVFEDYQVYTKAQPKEVPMRSKFIQTFFSQSFTKQCQTEAVENSAKAIQTTEETLSNKLVQTDPEKQRLKIKSRLENTIPIMDQETSTTLNLEEVFEENKQLKDKLEMLTKYQEEEKTRLSKIDNYWANQFKTLKDENRKLKNQVEDLQTQLKSTRNQTRASTELNKTFSHSQLRSDLIQKFFVTDETILEKCNPEYYLGKYFPRTERNHAIHSPQEKQYY